MIRVQHDETHDRTSSPQRVVARPVAVRWVSVIGAAIVLTGLTVVGVLLRSGSTGVNFYASDQISFVLLGVLLAAGLLLPTLSKVSADAEGLQVRNVAIVHHLAWTEVLEVSFPEGAAFARLELPHDEYISVLAVQAVDQHRAVAAVRGLRALHRQALTRAAESN